MILIYAKICVYATNNCIVWFWKSVSKTRVLYESMMHNAKGLWEWHKICTSTAQFPVDLPGSMSKVWGVAWNGQQGHLKHSDSDQKKCWLRNIDRNQEKQIKALKTSSHWCGWSWIESSVSDKGILRSWIPESLSYCCCVLWINRNTKEASLDWPS